MNVEFKYIKNLNSRYWHRQISEQDSSHLGDSANNWPIGFQETEWQKEQSSKDMSNMKGVGGLYEQYDFLFFHVGKMKSLSFAWK